LYRFRVNGSVGNSRRSETAKKSVARGAVGTVSNDHQRLVGGLAGSDVESTSVCDSDDDDDDGDDDCSSRLSSTATEQSDVRYARRRRHRHQHRHRPPAAVSTLFTVIDVCLEHC